MAPFENAPGGIPLLDEFAQGTRRAGDLDLDDAPAKGRCPVEDTRQFGDMSADVQVGDVKNRVPARILSEKGHVRNPSFISVARRLTPFVVLCYN